MLCSVCVRSCMRVCCRGVVCVFVFVLQFGLWYVFTVCVFVVIVSGCVLFVIYVGGALVAM